MEQRQNKTGSEKLKISLIAGLIIINSLFMFAPLAMADATCGMVNQKTDADKETMKKYIVTVLEEQIGEPGTNEVTVSLNCFRVTKKEGDKWNSTYEDSCPGITADTKCQRVQIFLAESGTSLLYGYISRIYRWAASVVGVMAVLYLIWGGIQIATAGDNSGKIDEAKQKIFQSIAGLILLFLSGVILYTINPNFFTL